MLLIHSWETKLVLQMLSRPLLDIRFLLCSSLLFLGACQTSSQLNQYPFFESHQLSEAYDFSSWWDVVVKHQQQKSNFHKCMIEPFSCEGKLRSYSHIIEQAKNLSREDQIELVHRYINRTPYDVDKVIRHYDHEGSQIGVTRNSWKTLYDFLIEGGDCEDYATAKYFMLVGLGIKVSDLRVVVTYSDKLFGYHAVLALRQPDNSIWLLDSNYPIKKNSHMGYRWIYAMNEQAVWDHRKDYLSTIE